MKTIISKAAMLVAFSCAAVLTSCEKDKKDDVVEVSKEQLFAKTWVVTSLNINPGLPNPNGGSPITDLYAQYQGCDKDDLYIVKSNGDYQMDEGATKCSDSDPQISESGKWTLSADKKTVSMKPNGDDSYEFEINELTATTMKTTKNERINGINYTLTSTFKVK